MFLYEKTIVDTVLFFMQSMFVQNKNLSLIQVLKIDILEEKNIKIYLRKIKHIEIIMET